jgi:outer membrane protein assembly factor BamB
VAKPLLLLPRTARTIRRRDTLCRTQSGSRNAEEQGYGFVRAFDMKTGDKKWEYKMGDITYAGVLSTASDLVFSGGREGYFYALNARTGELLWRTALGGQVNSGPMSYRVGGKQYIAVAAGSSLFAFTLKE